MGLSRGGNTLIPRRRISCFIGLLLVLGSLGTVRALDRIGHARRRARAEERSVPAAGYVRVLNGDSIEVVIDGRRTSVGILGITSQMFGTPCGDAARAELQAMLGRGVILEDDASQVFDARMRRMYRVSALDGRSPAAALVGAGLARTTGLGPETSTLAALEATARQGNTSCVWGGAVPPPSASASPSFSAQAAASVPENFVDETMASGLNFPTSFAVLPDGRILVAEKGGRVRLITSGGLQQTPVMDITSRVNNVADRGLLSIAIDPLFSDNGRFYLYYVYENNANDSQWFKTSQLAWFTLQGTTANPAAGTVILGTSTGAGCTDPLSSHLDCLPAENWSHAGGALRFGPDSKLYVSTGDAASYNFVDILALRTQNVDSLAGKVWIDTLGKGFSDNPYWDGDSSHPRSKVWAKGFRNPFRMMFRPAGPGGGSLYVGDVGWGAWEEIDVVTRDMNAGWPCYEGNHVQDGYHTKPVTDQDCQPIVSQPPANLRAPLIEWDHSTSYGPGGAALVGAFYNGAVFPASYQGALFYSDYAHGWIKSVRIDANNQLSSTPLNFADGINGPVQIESGPDGALWYLAIGSGELRRIRYVGNYTPISCPDGQWRAEYFNNKNLTGVPVLERCETAAINYNWGDGSNGTPGSPAPAVNDEGFSVRWSGRFPFGNDTYTFTTVSDDGIRVIVDDQMIVNDWVPGAANTVIGSKVMTAGSHPVVVEFFEDCCPASVQASWASQNVNTAPTPTIVSPAAGAKFFKVGDVMQLQGSASDAQQNPFPFDGLQWDVIQKHCPGGGAVCHDHPYLSLNGANRQFTVPDHGDGTVYEIRLTATDSGGLTGVTSRQVDPKTLQITLAANPSVGTVTYDGTVRTPPYTTTTIAGSAHQINAQPPAGTLFGGWTHGGSQQQTVTVGEQNVTYTANMGTACTPRPRVNIVSAPAGAGARVVTVSTSTNPSYPTNTLKSIAIQETRASTVEAPNKPASVAPFPLTYAAGTTQATFTIRRSEPGTILVRFTVTDDCGEWDSFIGSGSTTGF